MHAIAEAAQPDQRRELHEPARDVEVRLPGRRAISLEPITLMLPGSDAYLVQIHRRIDAGIVRDLARVFAIEAVNVP